MKGAGLRRLAVGDIAVAVGVVALDLVLFSPVARSPEPSWTFAGVLAYAALGGAALALRRRHPVAVFAFTVAHALVATFISGYRPTLPMWLALFTVAERGPRPVSLVALAVSAAPAALHVRELSAAEAEGQRWQTFVALSAFFAAVQIGLWGAGRGVRATAERHRREADRAAVAAVAREQARIARELHDIVSHTVTVMTLQCGGARRLLARDPQRAEAALVRMEDLGASATTELHRMLGVLAPGSDPDEDLPGLHRLEDLAADIRGAGVDVDIVVEGDTAPLDRSTDLTAYRVIQEALTNVARHAGSGSHARVTLRWAGSLVVEVVDTGAPPEAGATRPRRLGRSTGHGLLGLRERVVMVGGSLVCGPIQPTGYRVHADLPIAASPGTGPSGRQVTA